jgi:DNA mismatch endonuclease (patch repair protein)
MSSIKSSGTAMELAVKPALEAIGFTYQPKGVYGKPDFAHTEQMVAVFLDGCLWHMCPEHCKVPSSNAEFWREKLEANRARDATVTKLLESSGWRVIRVWEHDLNKLVKEVNSRANAGQTRENVPPRGREC